MSHLDKKDVDVATVACNKEGKNVYVWNSGKKQTPTKSTSIVFSSPRLEPVVDDLKGCRYGTTQQSAF